jgi:hypothetical protein
MPVKAFTILILISHQVVDEASACLGLLYERAAGLTDSNPWTICKFIRSDSPRYEQVWEAIKRLAQETIDDLRTYKHIDSPTKILESYRQSAKKKKKKRLIPTVRKRTGSISIIGLRAQSHTDDPMRDLQSYR